MLPTRIRAPLRIPQRSFISRLYTTPTNPRAAPQAALKEPEAESASYAPFPTTRTWTSSSSSNPVNGQPRQFIALPQVLPTDAQSESTAELRTLFPSSGVIDSAAMIGICLRREDHIPRAYSIFRQLLADYASGSQPVPDAELFGKVVEGVSLLGKPSVPQSAKWRSRAERIVEQWEEIHGSGEYQAALQNSGIKVYQGWLSGLVR
jgi:hypothetical protein